jgi:hypothetical protein
LGMVWQNIVLLEGSRATSVHSDNGRTKVKALGCLDAAA